jgi:cellulose synthase/poly-beta-1,6-N-acetylglucosamine synthase-like glycosyltransferase
LKKDKVFPKIKEFPKVSLIVPAMNEEDCLAKTVHSIMNLDYPKDQLQVIMVNHGSTDGTQKAAERLLKRYKNRDLILMNIIRENNHTKANAVNAGLTKADGKYIGCVDADTVLMEQCLKEMIPNFNIKNVGAVISTIKVSQPKNIWEKVQHLEYIFSTFMRNLMSKIETLHVTPGALSLYRKDLLDKYGGFDEDNITEDLEIAMRLQSHGYKIRIAVGSVTYTKVPDNIKDLKNQRVRWYRGFMHNNLKYKKMFMNKEYGDMGTFQYPVNAITFFTIILMFTLMTYEGFSRMMNFVNRFLVYKWEIFAFELPALKEVVLKLDLNIMFPIAISFCIALGIYHLSHKKLKEKWSYPLALILYIVLFPLLRGVYWMVAMFKESVRAKKKW